MREKLAELCHEQWSGWMKYLFDKGEFRLDGAWVMPPWAVDRWKGQMNAEYRDLSEVEKNSDRAEADKFLALIADSGETSHNSAMPKLLPLKFFEQWLKDAQWSHEPVDIYEWFEQQLSA